MNWLDEKLETAFQNGIEQGIEQGIEKGIEQGIEKGQLEKIKEIALRGLNQGYTFAQLAALTGFSEDKIRAVVDKC